MKEVFADALYWIAVVRVRDQWHESALKARQSVGAVRLVTTDEALVEFATALSKAGPHLRRAVVRMVQAILDSEEDYVLPQTHDGFLRGLDRFAMRDDKEYSLTDCISMNAMEARGIQEVLTHDRHFEQDGFTILIKPSS